MPLTIALRRAVASLAFLAPAALAAQDLPDAKALLAKHEAAMGGRAALDKHSSMLQTGTLSIGAMGIEGPLKIYRAKPNKFLFSVSLGPIGEQLRGYDGTVAWQIQPQQGPSVLSGAEAEAAKQQADFFADLGDASRFKEVATVGLVDFEGRKAWKVKGTTVSGSEVQVMFDAETGLQAGAISSQESPMGKVEITQVISEYKDFGGVKFPTKTVQRLPQVEITLTITDVTFDSVDAAVFNLPDAVKALVGK